MAQEIVNEQDLLDNGGGRTLLGNNLKVFVLFKEGAPLPILLNGGVDQVLENSNILSDGGEDEVLEAANEQSDGGVDSV